MQVVPLAAVPSQTFTVPLAGQRCQMNVYQKNAYPYFPSTEPQFLASQAGLLVTTENGALIVASTTATQVLDLTPRVYLDLYLNDTPVVLGAPAYNAQPILLGSYLGFSGELVFYDTQGNDDPIYTGLGARWFLAYLAPV